MKKLFLSFLIFLLALPVVWANDINYDIKQENSVTQIQTELQALINNATGGDAIMVTGSKTNADVRLELNIPVEVAVIWQATYQSDASFSANALIYFTGDGVFEVADGTLTTGANNAILSDGDNATVKVSSGNLSSTTGETIKITGDSAIVYISGGTVSATSENAVLVYGLYAKVIVSGGIVSNEADGNLPVIFINVPINDELNVIICGTGKVEARKEGDAILTYGDVEVKDNAQVSATTGFAIHSPYLATTVTVGGTSKITGAGVNTIRNGGLGSLVVIKDHAQVINTGTGTSIITADVEITDHAQVINENGERAIYAREVLITGGVVFAPTGNISNLIYSDYFEGVSGTGMLLAWNRSAGNINYEEFTTDDILKSPASATAHWDRRGGEAGIYYANGENTGFIPLDVTVTVGVVSVNEPIVLNLTVYPNPVSNILHIETGSNVAPEIKVFSIQGVLLLQAKGNEIDISSLDRGIYFVEIDGVCRKVVKQ